MDVWQVLRERLDYASFVPAPVRDVERADLKRRDGTPYTMLKNPHGDGGAGRYVRLDPADVEHWSNANRVVERVYRLGGWLAFTRVGGALVVGFGLYGLWLYFQEIGNPKFQLATIDNSYVLGIAVLLVLQVMSISVHEAGHGLAIRHYKRNVR